MYPLYVISGISGSGKTTLGKKVADRMLDENIRLIDQDSFYNVDKLKITLSDGSIVSNRDCIEALNSDFCNIIRDELNNSPILLTGFALPRYILPIQPLVHIHLITASNPDDLATRCCESRLSCKAVNEKRDALMVREVVVPFYHKIVRESDITHLLPVFDKVSKNVNVVGNRLPIESLVEDIIKIIHEAKSPRQTHHIMDVMEPYYSLIKSGIKLVEGRKISDKWNNIRYDDIITITCDNTSSFNVKVTGITLYLPSIGDPLNEYLNCETVARTLPGILSIEDGRNIYLQWSTEDEIKEMGMMGIQLQTL